MRFYHWLYLGIYSLLALYICAYRDEIKVFTETPLRQATLGNLSSLGFAGILWWQILTAHKLS